MGAGRKTDKGKYRKLGIVLAVIIACNHSAVSQAWGETAEDGLPEMQWKAKADDEDKEPVEKGSDAVEAGEPCSEQDGRDMGDAGDTDETDTGESGGDAGVLEGGENPGDAGDTESGENAGNAGDTEGGENPGNAGDTEGGENPGDAGDTEAGENAGDIGDAPESGEAAGDAGEPEDTANGALPGTPDIPPAVDQPDVLPGQPVFPVATSSEAAPPAMPLEYAGDEVTEEINDGDQLIEWLEDHKITGGNAVLVKDITIGSGYIYSSPGWGKKQDVIVDTCEYSMTIDADVDLSYYNNLTICGQGTPESVIKITPEGRLFLAANTIYAYGTGGDTYIIDQQPGSTLSIAPEYASMIQGNIRYSGYMTGELSDSEFPVYLAVPLGIEEHEIELPRTARVLIYLNEGNDEGDLEAQLPIIWDTSPVAEGSRENKRVCLTGKLDTGQYPGLTLTDTLECWLCFKTNDAIILNIQIRSGWLTCSFYTDQTFESVALMWSEDGEHWNEEKAEPPAIIGGKFKLSRHIETGKDYYICAKLVKGDQVSYSNVILTDDDQILEAPDLDGGRGGGTDIIGGGLPTVNRPSGSGPVTSSGDGERDSQENGGPYQEGGKHGDGSSRDGTRNDETGGPGAPDAGTQSSIEPEDGTQVSGAPEDGAQSDTDKSGIAQEQPVTDSDGIESVMPERGLPVEKAAKTADISNAMGTAKAAAPAPAAFRAVVSGGDAADGNPGTPSGTAQIVAGAAVSAVIILASAWAGPARISKGIRRLLKKWMDR